MNARINYAFIHSPPHHSPREPTHSTVTDNNIDTSLLLLLQANLKFEIVTKNNRNRNTEAKKKKKLQNKGTIKLKIVINQTKRQNKI